MSDDFKTHSLPYLTAIRIFQDIKLIDGPIGLSSSLRRHNRLVAWLKSQALDDLKNIEEGLDLYETKD